MIRVEPQEIQALVQQAVSAIARYWPLRTFIYRNPLQGFEHLPFHEAIRKASTLFGGKGYLSCDVYRALYRSGRITEGAILEAIRRSGILSPSELEIRVTSGQISPSAILRLHLIFGIEGVEESAFHWKVGQESALERYRQDVPDEVRIHPEALHVPALWESVLRVLKLPDPLVDHEPLAQDGQEVFSMPTEKQLGLIAHDLARVGRHRTLGEWVEDLSGIEIVGPVNDQMIRWCSAFLDEGMAAVSMPSRDHGFYRAWRDLAQHDHIGRFWGIRDLSQRIGMLPNLSEEVIAESLHRLGVEKSLWVDSASSCTFTRVGRTDQVALSRTSLSLPEKVSHRSGTVSGGSTLL